MRRRATLGITLALIAAGSCVPPPEDNDRLIDFKADTAMGVIQKRGTLIVGLQRDTPPLASTVDDHPQGFAVDAALDIADALGVDVDFVVASQEQLLAGVRGGADEATFDIAFPRVPITEELVRTHAVTDPYYVGHQRLLTIADSGVKDITDLRRGARVCPVDDPAATAAVEALVGRNRALSPRSGEACIEALSTGQAVAATASDLVLMSLAVALETYVIAGDQLSTEGYGAVVVKDPVGLADFVDGVLAEAEAEGRWAQWYERWFAPLLSDPTPEPPDMTAEEAAALFPSQGSIDL